MQSRKANLPLIYAARQAATENKTFETQRGRAATKTKPLKHGGTEEAEETQNP
jgi:hypothetical protein